MVIRLLAVLAVALLVSAAAQPNVVVIMADDLGFGDVGYNGSEIQTPHLDHLAAEGVRLDRFYTSPLCSPSRAGLLTGRYPQRMGISEPVTMADTVGLPPSETTLAEALRDAGYETAMVGKWHLGTACHHHPMAHGFDSFVGNATGGVNYVTRQTSDGLDWWRGYTPEVVPGYTTELIAAEAVDLLTRPRDGPLFLYLPFTAPHTPLQAPAADLALYDHLPEPRRTYAAMVTNLDRGIGEIMDAVEASGEPTLVWFLSDNGGVEQFGSDNGALRGGKGQTWEGAIRVPSVVWYPPWGARTITHPVWYLDVLPTVLGQVPGALAPSLPLDGLDQSALLGGAPPSTESDGRRLYSFRRMTDGGYWRGVQSATWKYHEQFASTRTRQYLFAIERDPEESRNRIRFKRDVVRRLRRDAEAFSALVPTWASTDTTLTVKSLNDLSECAAAVAPPPRRALASVAAGVTLSPPSPNPSAAGGRVAFTLAEAGPVRLILLDVQGRTVATLLNEHVEAGPHTVQIDGAARAAGVYVVRLDAAGAVLTQRLVVAR